MSDPIESDELEKTNLPARMRTSQKVVFFFAGSAVASAALFAMLVLAFRDRTPTLDRAALESALDRWGAAAIGRYSLELKLLGARTDVVQIEVRDGHVTSCTVNGRPPKERRVWETWAVASQFEYLLTDLDRAESNEGAGDVLCAEFDPKFGYPRHYRRSNPTTNFTTGWRIVRFEQKSAKDDHAQ